MSIDQFWKFGVFFLNGWTCFALVTAYVWAGALPKWNHPVFEVGVQYVQSLPWPSIAFRVNPVGFPGTALVEPIDCRLYQSVFGIPPLSLPGGPSCVQTFNHTDAKGTNTTLIFNASKLESGSRNASAFVDALVLTFSVICKRNHPGHPLSLAVHTNSNPR
jgi:hypothetical protein